MKLTATPPTDASQERIQKWIPLALRIAGQHFKGDTRFDLEERRSIALLALCKANISYDETKLNPQTGKPYSFGTYAGRVVWDHLRKAAYKAGSLMTRPSISNPRPELEREQQTFSTFSENVEVDENENLDHIATDDLVDWLMSHLDSRQKRVVRGMMRGETQTDMATRLGIPVSHVARAWRSAQARMASAELRRVVAPLQEVPFEEWEARQAAMQEERRQRSEDYQIGMMLALTVLQLSSQSSTIV